MQCSIDLSHEYHSVWSSADDRPFLLLSETYSFLNLRETKFFEIDYEENYEKNYHRKQITQERQREKDIERFRRIQPLLPMA